METSQVLKNCAIHMIAALNELSDFVDNEDGITSDIIDSEMIGSIIADTNAYGWTVEQCEILSVEPIYDGGVVGLKVKINWYASGQQDEDRAHYGNKAEGKATLVFELNGECEVAEISGEVKNDYSDHGLEDLDQEGEA
jgi:hypothetical protein